MFERSGKRQLSVPCQRRLGLVVFALALVCLSACPSASTRGPGRERPYTHTISTDDDEAHKDTGAPSRHVIGAE